MTQIEARPTTATLYERLGGGVKFRAIIGDIIDEHLANPTIQKRFEPFNREKLKEGAFLFFAQATGGPEVYTGRPLAETHRGMNINPTEFVAATDDVMAVLNRHGVGPQEQMEVLAAFFSLKDEVLHK